MATPRLSGYWFAAPRDLTGRTTVVAFSSVLLLWHVTSIMIANDTVLPSPASTLAALWRLATWDLMVDTFVTVRRVAIAFCIATIVGTVVGLCAGLFPGVGQFVLPLNSALRYVPPTAFIGLMIVWFGIYERSKIALIVIGIVFYLVQMTCDVVRTFPRSLAEAALNLGATRSELIYRVVGPCVAPNLLAVMRVNMGAAWTFVLVAEVVSAQRGIGNLLAVSQRFLATADLFALLVLIGILGYCSDTAFAVAIRSVSHWK